MFIVKFISFSDDGISSFRKLALSNIAPLIIWFIFCCISSKSDIKCLLMNCLFSICKQTLNIFPEFNIS